MAIEITPDDVRALNEKIVVARWFKHTDGTEDVWVKGSLRDILDHFDRDLTITFFTPEPVHHGND